MSAIQKVLDLQKQFEEAKQGAIQELLKQKESIDSQLKALGYGSPKTATTKQTRQKDPNAKCKICGQTGHDGRFHRKGKGKEPKPQPKQEAKK